MFMGIWQLFNFQHSPTEKALLGARCIATALAKGSTSRHT